jgi:hypothetical protein
MREIISRARERSDGDHLGRDWTDGG